MDEIRLTQTETFVYLALIHAGIGFALGLIPLVIGIRKGKARLGLLGLVLAILGGALIGFLGSIPAMGIFTWLILRDRHVAEDALPGNHASDAPPDETSSN